MTVTKEKERNKDILPQSLQSTQRGTDISGGEGFRLFSLCELCGLERSGREIIKQQEKGISSRRDRSGRREGMFLSIKRGPDRQKDLPFFLRELCGLERSEREIIKQQEKIFSRRDRRVRREELIFPVERVPGLAVSVNSVGSSEAGEI